jgi:thiol:disulfide interchange protein
MMKKLFIGLFACCVLLQVRAEDVVWLTDLPKALDQAKAEHKLVLADFTGSDWCVWCKKLDKETLSTQEFADYAKKNLVLLQLDYPDKKPQPDDLKAANKALAKKYNIQGYPTLMAFKPDGSVAWQNIGYLEGGPKALITQLDAVKQK